MHNSHINGLDLCSWMRFILSFPSEAREELEISLWLTAKRVLHSACHLYLLPQFQG